MRGIWVVRMRFVQLVSTGSNGLGLRMLKEIKLHPGIDKKPHPKTSHYILK